MVIALPESLYETKQLAGTYLRPEVYAWAAIGYLMSEPIIRVEGLRKSFGEREVLRGIAPGEVVVIIGPSGCGKSTLLRCLNYLGAPTQGRIWLRGEMLGRQKKEGRLAPLPEAEVDRQRTHRGDALR